MQSGNDFMNYDSGGDEIKYLAISFTGLVEPLIVGVGKWQVNWDDFHVWAWEIV